MQNKDLIVKPLEKQDYQDFTDMFCEYFKKDLKSGLIDEDIINNIVNPLVLPQLEKGILFIDLLFINKLAKGFIIYQIDSKQSDWNKREGHGFIREFYINNSERRTGLGTTLLNHAENKLYSLGVKNIYLTCADKEYVEDFYFKNGYKNENVLCKQNNLEYFSKEL